MTDTERADTREATMPEKQDRQELLPSAASLRPTHITSHLPPIKSLRSPSQDHRLRNRSPFPLRKATPFSTEPHRPPAYTTSRFPNSNTLQTFLSVTDVPHFGHPAVDSHADKLAAPTKYPTGPEHAWRVRKTPIFSGLLAPFSIVLEVPGLTSKWYAKIDQNGIVERFIDNPTILTVGLAISLGAAVVGNAAIILRFLEILKPRQSIVLAIVGFILHDLINVVALATFGGIYGPKHDGLSLSASYWMVCASTTTSVLVTISLVADYVRTKDFRHAGSGLTQLQKGLVLAGMGLLLYLSLGSLIFVFVIKTDFITALYFSCATILTVGFGDVVPMSPGSKLLVILYAPIGIVLVALVVSAARNAILETFQAALIARGKERRRRIAERKAAQKEHKRQDRALRKIMPHTFTFSPSAGNATQEAGNQGNDFAEALTMMEKQVAYGHDPNHETQADSGATAASVDTTATSSSKTAKVGIDADTTAEKTPAATAGDPALQGEISALQQHLLMAKQRSEQDFRQFEEHARREAIAAARIKLAIAASMTAAFWLLGAVAFTYAERWSYGGAMWFCFIAMITIGYGDYHPSTQLGRAIFVIWGLMGVAVLTILLAVVQDAFGSIFHRVLTNSTSRLFDRAEARARKRLKRQKQNKEEEEEEEDVEATAASGYRGKATRRRHHPHQLQRKSEGDVVRIKLDTDIQAAAEVARKSMEACIERSARTSSPEPLEQPISTDFAPVPSLLETKPEPDHYLHSHFSLPPTAAARVEDALVSTPQKLALAALQTFQHSVRVLQLHEPSISQTMADVPALRHYYNLQQSSNNDTDPDAALQDLHASIRQTANPEHEKVAKMVVANLEFEHQLRILLDGFQGIKERVEGYKQLRLQRSRTMSSAGADREVVMRKEESE